jgi:hypothetical protein
MQKILQGHKSSVNPKNMIPLITSQMQDDVLKWLCENVPPEQMTHFDWQSLLDATGIDSDTTDRILINFKDQGLIASNYNWERMGSVLLLKVEAHKLLQRGGFTVQDALNEANMQKLLYELDHLKKQLNPDQLDTLNKVTQIMASIATVVAAFQGKS